MFAFTSVVELEATSADRSVLDAVEHAVARAHLTRDFIPDHVDGVRVDLSFASERWQRIVVDRGHAGTGASSPLRGVRVHLSRERVADRGYRRARVASVCELGRSALDRGRCREARPPLRSTDGDKYKPLDSARLLSEVQVGPDRLPRVHGVGES
jgi:hypothetical protein